MILKRLQLKISISIKVFFQMHHWEPTLFMTMLLECTFQGIDVRKKGKNRECKKWWN